MSTITLPGLIDVHTHLRVPGGEHKEDFRTGTAAALAGGITQVLAMPNTSPPIATTAVLADTLAQADRDSYVDVGIYAGASGTHVGELAQMSSDAIALKIYLNDTFGTLRIDEVPDMMAAFEAWPQHKPLAMHAEKQSVAVGIALAAVYQRPVHFCHISRREEIELIAKAKARGLPITCEVCPHHLFLTRADAERLGPFGDMRPLLGSESDVAALWEHINDTVDCIATDHAPHTIAEKESDQVPPGVPGVETSLSLMWTAVASGRLTQTRLRELMFDNPRRIYNLPFQPDTVVELNVDAPFLITAANLHSKCGWTPFEGTEVVGRVSKVTIRGQLAYADGEIVVEPGFGQLIRN